MLFNKTDFMFSINTNIHHFKSFVIFKFKIILFEKSSETSEQNADRSIHKHALPAYPEKL